MAIATSPRVDIEVTPREPEGLYEIVDGQVVETPPMGAFEVDLATRLVVAIGGYALTARVGKVQSEMLFLLDRARNLQRRPDLAFVSQERWPIDRRVPRAACWDVVPDLAVEVVSPTNLAEEVQDKLEDYFRAGVRLVWVVYPGQGKVYGYISPTEVRILSAADELDGGAVLPGFRMPLMDLFGGEDAPEA